MKIVKVILENFRAYQNSTSIEIDDLNVLVGKNDVGKSTVLEALDIFFNEGKGSIKIEKNDVNKSCRSVGNTETKISVIFSDFPPELIIDNANPTTLQEEFLLLENGTLEIMKKYNDGGKEKVFIKANHPTNENCKELLQKKNTELKAILDANNIDCDDRTRNAFMRRAIWNNFYDDLQLEEIEIDINKIDARDTWTQLKKYMPLFALFQSDRKNSDGDCEVQDPLRYAVKEILSDENIREQLDIVASEVLQKLKDVTASTLEKLNEMNENIADSLNPIIPEAQALKWEDVFKVVFITDENDIPVNKRGSGVKRLILINFFRAEAERRRNENNLPDIIYAMEEPETSQHPEYQRLLINALISLSTAANTQVILTTHSPAIVKLLDFSHIRLIKSNPDISIITIDERNLPYASLNEVNYLAFEEVSEEYHDELYSYIETRNMFDSYRAGKPVMNYKRIYNGQPIEENIILSKYIRHQIHHPENTLNARYTDEQLKQSILEMRSFISSNP